MTAITDAGTTLFSTSSVFDKLDRLSTRTLTGGAYTQTTFYAYEWGTTLPQSVTVNGSAVSYTYDEAGNITTITDGSLITYYAYDGLNQLVREDNAYSSKTVVYTYDNGGNILSKTEYPYSPSVEDVTTLTPTNTVTYAYKNTDWKDQLTSFNGEAITYDAIGNPLSYRGMTLTWQNGRQLATLSKEGLTASYTYNELGLRTSKTINGVTTEYYWNGSQLLGQKTGDSYLYFLYDERGMLVGFNDGTKTYIYTRNLQGDITTIIDTATGNTVAQYTYDSWGNVLTATGTMAEANPFRYRGYYYDTETELYYLQSRYYDAEAGRFISADSLVGKGILGTNIYAYCSNNPVIKADQSGYIEHFALGIITQIRKMRETEEAFHNAFKGNYGFEFQNKPSADKRFSPSHVTNSVDIISIKKVRYLETQKDRLWNNFSLDNSAVDTASLIAEAALEGYISFLSVAEIVIGKLFNTGGPATVIREAYVVEYFENGKYTYNGGTVQSSYEMGWIYKGVAVYYVGAGVLANGGYEYFEHGYSQYMQQKLVSGYLQLGGQFVYAF